IGTAGFTAMASVLALEAHGLTKDGDVLVSGATGGVGSLAVTFLAARGYRPVASTGSLHESGWLSERGAARIIGRDEISDRPDRILGNERWAGAVDCIGGDTLVQILRSLVYGGAVAASGLVAGTDLHTTIYPFITRAVSLLGVDAVEATRTTRDRVWEALGDVAPKVALEPLVDRVVGLHELVDALDTMRAGQTRGRILVMPTPG
ncbi:MAG: zinc-binding dehydrogenase, partial [Acidimicrobiales bacterium]